MLASQRLTIEQSSVRQRINDSLSKDTLTDEERAALDKDTARMSQIGVELRAALTVETADEHKALAESPTPEHRERLELRKRAKLTNYLLSALSGRQVDGAELELRGAAGVTDGIPLELFDLEERVDAPTTAPTTGTGVNVDPIIPLIYARAVMPRLGVRMPRVSSGTYSTMTVSAGLSAGAMVAGVARESTAAVLTPQTTTPHRISARLSLRVEDISLVGVGNYEAILRQNLMLAMSSQLDTYGLTGDNSGANPAGLLQQLTDPSAPPAGVVSWNGFVQSASDGIDGGPWAETMEDVRILTNAETMRLASRVFQTSTSYQGELSAAEYLREHTSGFFSSARMPATDAMVAQAVRVRMGTMGLDGVDAISLATLPIWNVVNIDDIFSDSASGTRHFTMHHLCGDLLIQQPDAYEQISYRVSV